MSPKAYATPLGGGCRRTKVRRVSQPAALARLFSSGVFQEMARKGRSSLFARLLTQTGVPDRCNADSSVADAFDSAFEELKIDGLRDEYVYRSALTHRVLLGTHSLRTACMLNEFRVAACKADLVILNGTATVYEIKSERDTLARLVNQIDSYRRAFGTVYVITSDGHLSGVVEAVPSDVGVMTLSSRYQISTVREAVDQPARICPATVFESLRSSEAGSILKGFGIALPAVPNTERHAAMQDLFLSLDPAELHVAMVNTLKRTRSLAPLSTLVERLPRSLHSAALSIRIRRADHDRLVNAVSTPLDEAMNWS